MKPSHPFSIVAIALTTLTLAFQGLTAQTLTETLQKQIWPGATSLPLDAWEMMLPDRGQDTVFYRTHQLAEVVLRDQKGFPLTITLLEWSSTSKAWIPQTRSTAVFDDQGTLLQLMSWTWQSSWNGEGEGGRNGGWNGEGDGGWSGGWNGEGDGGWSGGWNDKWNGVWQNESLALRHRDADANDLSFELLQWENEGWTRTYHLQVGKFSEMTSAKMAP